MKDRTLRSSFFASALIHLLAIPLASAFIARPASHSADETIAVDLIDIPRVEEKKEEIVHSQPLPPKPEKVTPPKLVYKPTSVDMEPPLPPMLPLDEPKKEEPRPISIPLSEPEKVTPARLSSLPLAPGPPGPVKGSIVSGNSPGEAEGGEAGAGNLFAKGDVGVVPGAGVGGGGGGKGNSGLGGGERGRGSGGGGSGDGFGQGLGLARPLGGYQVKPRYPESARREGAQGVTLLKARVLENGTVGDILVEQSTGHPELDRSAAEAVKKWRFEPARRGNETVAVWVLLPVKFQLQ